MKTIQFFDTTLRDGEQGIGNLMSTDQKIQIVKQLDELGLDIIELGFPAASTYDYNVFKRASYLNLNTKICAFSRPIKKDLKKTVKALKGFRKKHVELLGTGSELHLQKKRQITTEQALDEVSEAVKYLKEQGIDDVSIILEDSSRGSHELISTLIHSAIKDGIKIITIADTVGCTTPSEISEIVKHAKKVIDDRALLGIHCHNDLGLATANTLEAIRAGADMVQVTMGGIGERAGNCAIEEVLAALHYKPKHYKAWSIIDTNRLAKTCKSVFKTLDRPLPANKAIIGEHVFSTAAGIHQNGLIKDKRIYEYVESNRFDAEKTCHH